MTNFDDLAAKLDARGIGSYLQNPDLLVVSSLNPAVPGANCFWVRKKLEHWYIGTWLPAVYEMAGSADVVLACEAIFRSSSSAIYTVEDSLVASFNLRRLAEDEIETVIGS